MSLGTLTIIAGAISAIGIIVTCVVKIYKLARSVENKIETYDKNINQLTLHLNRMALLNTDLPLIDRLHAGERYLAGGGNGFGKKVYDQLLRDLDTSVWGNTTWAESQYRSYQLKKQAEELEVHEYINKREELNQLKKDQELVLERVQELAQWEREELENYRKGMSGSHDTTQTK